MSARRGRKQRQRTFILDSFAKPDNREVTGMRSVKKGKTCPKCDLLKEPLTRRTEERVDDHLPPPDGSKEKNRGRSGWKRRKKGSIVEILHLKGGELCKERWSADQKKKKKADPLSGARKAAAGRKGKNQHASSEMLKRKRLKTVVPNEGK